MPDETNQPPISIAEYSRQADALIQRALEEQRRQAEKEIPAEARLWMALAPGWTAPMAHRCDFPGIDPKNPAALFENMADAGLAERFAANPAAKNEPGAVYYVLTKANRAAILDEYIKSSQPRPESFARQEASLLRRLTKTRSTPEDASGAGYLLEILASIGPRVFEACATARESLSDLPREVCLWAQLTKKIAYDIKVIHSPDTSHELACSQELDHQVQQEFNAALRDRQVAQHVGAIQEWIEAARPVAVLLEYAHAPQLSRSIAKAGRQIELLQRRQYETGHLDSFYRRGQQIAVIKDFLEGPPDLWALHLIGAGGVGKTMLIRYLTCALNVLPDENCTDEDLKTAANAITARIDFDYLNPQYPRQDPGLLLWSLGQELRISDVETVASSRFDAADRKFTQLRQILQTGGDQNQPALLWSTSHPLFREGVVLFLEGLRLLNRPVILILDTCEELEKFSPENDPQQNVEETFRILRALHDGVHVLAGDPAPESSTAPGYPNLRVILSGRRLLASRGAYHARAFGWECLDSQDINRPEFHLVERPYLRLYELHGFTHGEAEDFLHQEDVPSGLIPAVIQASSPDVPSEIHIQYADQTWLNIANEERCNPYTLRLFMDWAKEEENPPTPEDLLSAAQGRYVELRIISRLRDEDLRRALPLVALLGHFDKNLLAAAAGIDDQEAGEIYTLLLRQEWTTQHRAPDLDGEPRFILDVQRSIRNSLYSYFANRHELPDNERRRAAHKLRKFLLSGSPAEIDWTDYDTALRVVEADLEDAAAWWEEVETRLFSDPDPQASLKLLGLLTGGDGSAAYRSTDAPPETPPENRLRPFVLATQASLLFKIGQYAQLQKMWAEVIDITLREPDSPAYAHLHLHALAALLSLSGPSGISVADQVAIDFWQALVDQPGQAFSVEDASTWLGAAEAILETVESWPVGPTDSPSSTLAILGYPQTNLKGGLQYLADKLFGPLVNPQEFSATAKSVPQPQLGLAAFACALAGQAAVIARQLSEAQAYFAKALETVELLEMRPDGALLPAVRDWLPPDHLPSRIRLAFIQAAFPAWLSAAEALSYLPPAKSLDLNSVDGERLLAARLRLELAAGVPKLSAEDVSSSPFHPGVCNAHRRELPYQLRQAEALAAQGDAPAVLKFFLAEISAASQNLVALAQIQRAFLQFLVRFRLNDEGFQPQLNLPSVPDYHRYLYTRLYNALSSPEPPEHELAPADVLFTMESLAELQAVHLMWIGIAASPPANQALINFASNSILPALLNIAPLIESGLSFSEASLKLDFIEALALLSEKPFGLDPALIEQLTRLDPLAWSENHPSEPEAALRLLLRCLALAGSTTIDTADGSIVSWPGPALESASLALAVYLGLRRAGEIAFQEGQLLGLRLPIQALVLLDWAVARFSEAGAFCDAWLASLQHALLTLHTQPRRPEADVAKSTVQSAEGLQSSIKRAETCYRQIPVQVLPWEELADPARHLLPAWLDSLPVGLRPSLLRQILCLDEARGLSQDQFVNWLGQHYLQIAAHGAYYPLEWRPRFTPGSPAAQEKESQGCSGLLKEYWKFLGGISTILFGVFCAWYFLFGWVIERYISPWLVTNFDLQTASSYQNLNIWGQFAIALAALLILIAVVFVLFRIFPGLGRVWQGYWLAKGYLAAEITPLAASGPPPSPTESWQDRTIQAAVTLTPHLPRLNLTTWRLYRLEPRPSLQSNLAASPSEPYLEISPRLQAEFVKELKHLARLLGKRRKIRLDLKIAPSIQQINWEAVLALAVNPETPDQVGFAFERIPFGQGRQDFQAKIKPEAGEALEIAVLCSSNRAAEASRQGWSRLAETSKISMKVYKPGTPLPHPRIIHVWGTIEDRFGTLVFGERTEAFMGSQLESFSTEEDQADSAGDLTLRYPRLALCILQGSIGPPPPERFETERVEAGLLRQFAADLQAQGNLVILLPGNEPDQVVASITELSKVLPTVVGGDPNALHPAIHAIRGKIRAAGQSAGPERAMDILVFMP